MLGYCPGSLKLAPALLKAAFLRLPKEKWDVPTGPDRFSPREVIFHMAFWEPVARGRMELARLTDGVEVPDWDEDQHAKENAYHTLDPLVALDAFAEERGKTMSLFESLEEEEWEKAFVHPVKGRLTMFSWGATMLGHDLYHLHQLEEAL
jgi:hypothetical protein